MPTATATCPPDSDTQATGLMPGIRATEADLITNTARRFLARADTAPPEAAMATVTADITALYGPYTPASIDDYSCEKPNDTHWWISR